MKKKSILGAALAAGLVAGAANAAIHVPNVETDSNSIFAMEEVASPSLLIAGHGKCGAGKCGGDKSCKGEGKCKGESSCKGKTSCKGESKCKS